MALNTEHPDREILTQAADAIGLPPLKFIGGWVGYWAESRDGKTVGRNVTWNPLTDDGDALRLAVALNLSIAFTLGAHPARHGTAMVGFAPWEAGTSPLGFCKFASPDEKPAATRRAILLASAEIGRTQEAAHG